MRAALATQVFSVEARKLMSYRTDFWVNAFAVFGAKMLVAYYLWVAIFAESGQLRIGGFSRDGMILYYLLALLLSRVVSGAERQMTISQDIYEGGLTRYLLYPAGYFGFKYAEHLGTLVPSVVQLVLFGGIASQLFNIAELGKVSAGSLLRAAVAVAVANLLSFLLLYLVQGVAFWADNVWSLQVMLRFITSMLGGLMLPLDLFPAWAQRIVSLLPFQALYYFPTMTLLGRVEPLAWLRGIALALAWSAALALVARAVWRRGYRTYTGVGI